MTSQRTSLAALALVPVFAPLVAVVLILAFPYPALEAARGGVEGARLLDRSGALLASLPGPGDSFMERLSAAEVPVACREIFVRLEDRRFYAHAGVDPIAAARAAFGRLAGTSRSGASTITMQYARLISPHPRTLWGKLREAVDAARIERRLSKEEILIAWLNRLPFGRNTVGVGAAARTYFDAELRSLSPAELLLLAIIPRNPTRFDPFDSPPALLAEAERAAAGSGLGIDRDELQAALREVRQGGPTHRAPHFERFVIGRLSAEPATGRGKTQEGSGEVRTTLDLELNAFIEGRIKGYLEQARNSRVTNAAVVAIENATGNLIGWVGSRDFHDERTSGEIDGALIRRQSASTLKPFLYELALERGWTAASLVPDVPLSFGVLSSSVDPDAGDTELYRPVDFDQRSRGVVRLRTALASSLNAPAVYLLSQVGLPSFLERLASLGFRIPADASERWGLGAAIGNAEVSLLELARAYTIFARGGSLPTLQFLEPESVWPRTIGSAATGSRATGSAATGSPATGSPATQRMPMAPRIADEKSAWIVADMLSDPAARSTGFGTRTWFSLPFEALFKSGTSTEFTDLWCVGSTPGWTVGAWAGNFDGRAVINKTGSSLPARIVADVLVRLKEEAGAGTRAPTGAGPSGARMLSDGAFRRPAGILEATICTVSGGLATSSCPSTRPEYFVSARDLPAPCRYHPGGSRQELLFESLLAPGGAGARGWQAAEQARVGHGTQGDFRPAARIVLPVDGATFWLDRRLSPAVQRVPVLIAAREGLRISLSLDGEEIRQLEGSATLELPATPGDHRLELVGSGVRLMTRFRVR